MKRFPKGAWAMAALFGLLVVLLYLLSSASENATRFEELYIGLLLLNSAFLLALLVWIGFNLVALIRKVLRRAPGSQLTLRMMTAFVVFALVPAAVVYVFSIQMLEKGIDSWFDVRVERALVDALDLSRASLDLFMREALQKTEPMTRSVAKIPNVMAPLTLSDILRDTGASEVTLLGENNRIIASSSDLGGSMLPRLPGDSVLRLVTQGDTYIGLDPLKDEGLHVRVVMPVPPSQVNPERRILQVLYPVQGHIDELADSVQSAFGKYNELVYLRTPLKQSFILTLSLVLLLAVLFAVWAAFYSARRLMEPIRDLAEGTRAVASGDYNRKLPVGQLDDLGMLLVSFNQMTERLAQARDAAEASQRLVERQRTYLETVLEHLSSGVISVDPRGVLRTVNAAAGHILGMDLDRHVGDRLSEFGAEHSLLGSFYESLKASFDSRKAEWQEQVTLMGPAGRKVLMCSGAALPGGGQVVVFDDITTLIQAQRDAAWAEVARRLAHEIKNPLTPIQLSVERLQRKLLPKLDEQDAEVLNRSVRTISQQVDAMKAMVNAFSDYARTPAMDMRPLALNGLVEDVVELYRHNLAHTRIESELEEGLPLVEADAGRMRQLLHNLIKNALEALTARDDAILTIRTRCVEEGGCRFVELDIEDNGPGIPEDLMVRLFEPYVTSKARGTGLGLAIVKKIVEEHGGTVWAENCPGGGARIRIRLLAAIELASAMTVNGGGT